MPDNKPSGVAFILHYLQNPYQDLDYKGITAKMLYRLELQHEQESTPIYFSHAAQLHIYKEGE